MSQPLDTSSPAPTTDRGWFPAQLTAVTAPIGPVMVLAGPGAGKTRCLTGRIQYLVEQMHATPQRICAVTFTNKAAEEIVARMRQSMDTVAEQPWLGTIHALCLQLLRPFAKTMGLPPGFGVADESQQYAILNRLRVWKKRQGQLLRLFGLRRLTRYKLTPEDEATFKAYGDELERHRLVDYDGILVLARQLLDRDPGALASYQNRWDHILVDEFQDLDPCQYEILALLAARHRSLFVVGDDEQSIFSWRGADPNLARRFQLEFQAKPIVLDVNCRCSVPIFETARRILPQDGSLFEKDIRAVRDGMEPVRAVGFEDETAEAAWVVKDILEDLEHSQLARGEYAVLYRNHDMGAGIEQALLAHGIPCRLGKGRAMMDDPVIRQLITSLRIVLSPDSDLDVEALAHMVLPEQVLQRPGFRGEGRFMDSLRAFAHANRGAKECWRLLYQIENLTGLRASCQTLGDLVRGVLSLGIGRYPNPLEKRFEQLTDPRELPLPRTLSDAIAETMAADGRILVGAAGGLEVVVALMLRKALPMAEIAYAREETARASDLVLDLAGTAGTVSLADAEGLRTTAVFKALQLVEARGYRKLLGEYVVFDTETTGKEVDTCEVVELAAARVRGGEVVDRFRSLIHCRQPITPGAHEVHGYADEDLQGQPEFAEVWPKFRAFVGDTVLVAHNGVHFDVPVLNRLAASSGGLAGMPVFDTLPLARQLPGAGGVGLEALAARFGVETGRSHHALDDCLCLAGVVERLMREYLKATRMTCQVPLLEYVALGAALEDESRRSAEDDALVDAGIWKLFGRYSRLLSGFETEAFVHSITCPTTAEITERLGGQTVMERVKRTVDPEDRYAESYARFRGLVERADGVELEQAIREFLDTVALSRSDGAGTDEDHVNLLTFHSTKGLEFSRVYILGVEDDSLPGWRAIKDDLEDETREARRLLYVAMTRAKDRLVLTRCAMRADRPTGGTRFLTDLGLTIEPR